jgi:hypothetical protein
MNARDEELRKSEVVLLICAGVAESGKGAGLRTLSRRSPRVQITPPALKISYGGFDI